MSSNIQLCERKNGTCIGCRGICLCKPFPGFTIGASRQRIQIHIELLPLDLANRVGKYVAEVLIVNDALEVDAPEVGGLRALISLDNPEVFLPQLLIVFGFRSRFSGSCDAVKFRVPFASKAALERLLFVMEANRHSSG